MKIEAIAAACDLGLVRDGAAEGARTLARFLGQRWDLPIRLVSQAEAYVKERGRGHKSRNLAELQSYTQELYTQVSELLARGKFPLLLGGDHSVAVSSALASQAAQGPLGVIWVDAHTDFNTLDSTETGNLHGCPLATLVGYGRTAALRDFYKGRTFAAKNAVAVGVRSIDREEAENLRDAGICVYSTEDLRSRGLRAVLDEAYARALDGTRGLHISFDLDVFDPSVVPGVSVPVAAGLERAEGLAILDYILERRDQLRSFDLVELNPLLDEPLEGGRTAELAREILERFLAAYGLRPRDVQ